MIWGLAFEKKPFQFWREILIQVVVTSYLITDVLKVALSQKGFHFGSNLQKKVPNQSPEHYLPKENVFRAVIWLLFLEIRGKVI
jgi:hypothetical protein